MDKTAIIVSLEEIASLYTEDLRIPFGLARAANAALEMPLLILSDVCKSLGLCDEERECVLGNVGLAFVEYCLDVRG